MTLHALVEGFDVLDDVRSRSIPGEEFDASLLFVVSDGKGNKVFKKTRKTGDYGIASADFKLANLVNVGCYKPH